MQFSVVGVAWDRGGGSDEERRGDGVEEQCCLMFLLQHHTSCTLSLGSGYAVVAVTRSYALNSSAPAPEACTGCSDEEHPRVGVEEQCCLVFLLQDTHLTHTTLDVPAPTDTLDKHYM